MRLSLKITKIAQLHFQTKLIARMAIVQGGSKNRCSSHVCLSSVCLLRSKPHFCEGEMEVEHAWGYRCFAGKCQNWPLWTCFGTPFCSFGGELVTSVIKKGSKNGATCFGTNLLPIRGPEGHPALRVYSSNWSLAKVNIILLSRATCNQC